jgi:peroxisomal 3,2-trans-enoyl-CoA isomerase
MAPPPSLSTILIDRPSPAVALISYNRPKIANAFDVTHYLNTADALIWARDELDVKVVIV